MAKCKNCRNSVAAVNVINDEKMLWCIMKADSIDLETERDCDIFDCMTNADRIRNMSDGELSEWIHNIVKFQGEDMGPMVSLHNLDKEQDDVIFDSYRDLLEWLQKEVE